MLYDCHKFANETTELYKRHLQAFKNELSLHCIVSYMYYLKGSKVTNIKQFNHVNGEDSFWGQPILSLLPLYISMEKQ